MERLFSKFPQFLFLGIYFYLVLPIIIFFFFWLKRPIGIPAVLIVMIGTFLCYKAHDFKSINFIPLSEISKINLLSIFAIVIFWVILSGVGGYTWQNADHYTRNQTFNVMVSNPWPVYSNTSAHVPLVYYIGYWLPAAVIGKLFGLQAGYLFQAIWAVIGILLCYGLICLKRKKVSVWPMMIFVFFSGLDAIGTTFIQADTLKIFGSEHIEWWAWFYQYSSITTQLFWVFNQALPAWVACLFIFLYEKPKNMLFTLSTLLLSSSFPFIGLIPFVIYFMVKRAQWNPSYSHAHHLVASLWHNWASIQNIAVPMVVGSIIGLYLIGNESVSGTIPFIFSQDGTFRAGVVFIGCVILVILFWAVTELALHLGHKIFIFIGTVVFFAFVALQIPTFDSLAWWSDAFVWMNLTIFYFLEAGIYLLILNPFIKDKHLLLLNAVCLYVIPLIRVGYAFDFCMRASIPGLLLIVLWIIDAFDNYKILSAKIHPKLWIGILTGLLVIGSVTPIHEIKRTYFNTFSYYEPITISEEEMFSFPNVCGDRNSFFWKYLARR